VKDKEIIDRAGLTEEFLKSRFYKKYFESYLEEKEKALIFSLIQRNSEEVRGMIKFIREIRSILKEWVNLKEIIVKRKEKNESG